jgi:hypothetical protein
VSKRSKIIPPALKHGGYSGLAVLPGEDKAAFEKLHRDLIAELNPKGPLEEDIVVTLARYVWRKQNLKTYQLAQAAKKRRVELMTTLIEREDIPEEIVARMLKNRTAYPQIPRRSLSEENIAKVKSIVEQLHEQMNNQDFELAEIADDLTTANLQNELALIDRLDAMIDRAIKRVLMVRGIKSLAVSPVAVLSRTPLLVSTSSCA